MNIFGRYGAINRYIERKNSIGQLVPKKCNKCNSDIHLYMKYNTPTWMCDNTKCRKSYGLLPEFK